MATRTHGVLRYEHEQSEKRNCHARSHTALRSFNSPPDLMARW